eukprot:scaffold24_cov341-Pavlova_lutheri.AAC.100
MGAGGGGTTSAGLIENGANDGMVDIVDGAMDEELRHVATTPISSPGENSLQIVARPKGRVWTNAHNKAMLDVLREEDCCFLVKRTNGDKGVAWKRFVERLKGAYPKLFGSWDLDRKQVRKRIGALLKAHRANEEGAMRATGRGGGMVDEELAHLCDEVAERVAEADGRKGAAQEEKVRARELKDKNGEMLAERQLQTGGKRARPPPRSNSSPDESAHRASSRGRRTSGDKNRAVIIPELQKSLVAVLRSQERRDALDEWRLRDEAHRNDPFRHADPGSLDDWIRERFVTRGQGTSMHRGPSATQQEDEEVESPLKEGRDASYM